MKTDNIFVRETWIFICADNNGYCLKRVTEIVSNRELGCAKASEKDIERGNILLRTHKSAIRIFWFGAKMRFGLAKVKVQSYLSTGTHRTLTNHQGEVK